MSRFKHPIRIGLGITFVILGLIGILIPVMPQTIFFLIAVALFFPTHPRVEQGLRRIEPRWPRFAQFLRRLGVGDNRASGEREPSHG